MVQTNSFHHGDLKRALLDAGFSLLDGNGIEAVTIRAVAREAGVSHAAPKNHFPSRSALLTAMAEVVFRDLLEQISQNLRLTTTNRVQVIADALIDFGLEFPARYQMIWSKDLVDHENTLLLAVMDEIYDLLCAEIKSCNNDEFDVDTHAVALWSMVHGYVDLRLKGVFEDKKDMKNKLPRRRAILDLLFR